MAESLLKPLTNIYENETIRQNTFLSMQWPLNAPVWPMLLAKAGFYYKGIGLDVTCFSCGIVTSVGDWIRNIHPQQIHFKLNPDCEFIKSVLKPEGGSKTFNDHERWQISNQKGFQESSKEDNSISQKDEGMCSIPKDMLDSEKMQESNNVITSENSLPSIAYQPSIQNNIVSQDSGFSTLSTVSTQPAESILGNNLLVSGSSTISPFLLQRYLASNSEISQATAITGPNLRDQSDIPKQENVTCRHPAMKTVPARMDTFATWPHKEIQPPKILVTAGYFYTLDGDIVRCFCCDLGLSEWDEHDDAWSEHARHSPNCWYLKRIKGQKFIDEVQMKWKKIYNPKFPNLIEEADRIKTFHNWPNLIDRPTRVEIAKSGFYFTGRGDECRCHYCDGGLQHWERGDNPWEQHAYHFPFCKFVIRMKGREFINEVRERFSTYGADVDALIKESEELEAALSRDDVRDRKIKEIMSKKEFKDILDVGYSKKAVKMAAEELFKQKGNFNFTVEQVLNMILDLQDRGEELPGSDGEDVPEEPTIEKPLLPADEFMKLVNQQEPLGDAIKVIEENRLLKESMLCWKCKKEPICILFTPCGHRLTCENCSKTVHHCMKCNKKVKKKYKTYLA